MQLDPPRATDGPPAADVAAVHDAVRAAVAHGRAGRGAVGGGARRRRRRRLARARCGCGCRSRPPGTARIARADGNPVVGDVDDADGAGARLVVSRLEHVAGWELIRALGDHPSPLADLVTLDLFECRPGETRRPADRAAARHRRQLRARRTRRQLDGSWAAPAVFMELHSHADRDLFVAVLDLTDRFRCHAVVPTVKLGAGRPLALNDGDPLPATLPDGVAGGTGRSRCATGSR